MEARGAVDAVRIEQRQRRIAERRGALDERFRKRCAPKEAERRRGVKFDIHEGSGNRNQDSGLGQAKGHKFLPSVHYALDKPPVRVTLAEHAAGGAVVERHVPFIAIPSASAKASAFA